MRMEEEVDGVDVSREEILTIACNRQEQALSAPLAFILPGVSCRSAKCTAICWNTPNKAFSLCLI